MKFLIATLSILLMTQNSFAQASNTDDIMITAVGDVMMGTNYPTNDMLPPDNGLGLFEPAKQWIETSDIRLANFEGTLYDGDIQEDGKRPGPNKFLFRTPTVMGQRLVDAGFNVVSLANNHSRDFGQAGLDSTMATLDSLGITYSSKQGHIAYFEVKDKKLAMIAVDYYRGRRSVVNPESTYKEIIKLKREGYLVIVSAHVGGEGKGAEVIPTGDEMYLNENRGNSVEFARTAVDLGADVIIMHGPHVPRAIELYKNKLIVYSLGNFITGKGIVVSGSSGYAPLIRFQINSIGDFVGGQIVSFLQLRHPQRIIIDRQARAYKLIQQMSQEQFGSQGLVFEPNGVIRKLTP